MTRFSDFIQLGLVNRISTGYILIDIALCIIVPWILEVVQRRTFNYDLIEWLIHRNYINRIIKTRYTESKHGKYTCDRATKDLQDAILYMVNKNPMAFKNKDSSESFITINSNNESVVYNPPLNKWLNIKDNIFLKIQHIDERTEHCIYQSIIFYLEIRDSSGLQQLDDFITNCYEQYNQNKYVINSSCRNMFIPFFGENNSIQFEQYKLEDTKTFDMIFHPEKKTVVKLIDDFVKRDGKFKVKGFPYKLGFLLYGKPGTGKTSFIKALASYTKRHVINISLSKIETNQQLVDLMFNTKLIPKNSDRSDITITFDSVIYVLEDVDAISEIVKDRAIVEEKLLVDFKKEEKKNKLDKLNLAGLLNVLDGIVDTPGRILIMTTNHPEKLDPALVRPGRVNKHIHMNEITALSVIEMIEYYMGSMNDNQKNKIIKHFPSDTYTPAFIESKCLDFDNVEQMVNWAITHSK